MQNISFDARNASEWVCFSVSDEGVQVKETSAAGGLSRWGTRTMKVPESKLNELWSQDPHEAIAKRIRERIDRLEGTNAILLDEMKFASDSVEYNKQLIANMLEEHKDLVAEYPELFL